jgi:hypothetical protein
MVRDRVTENQSHIQRKACLMRAAWGCSLDLSSNEHIQSSRASHRNDQGDILPLKEYCWLTVICLLSGFEDLASCQYGIAMSGRLSRVH